MSETSAPGWREIAPAKVNLALHVRGKLPDGRHSIETLFAFCIDGDQLTGEPADALELTIVGPPVVGAVRMVTAASRPKEIVANVYLGEHLSEHQDGVYQALGVTATREYRPTKEYPKGQEVYALTFDPPRADGGATHPPSGR